MWVNEMKILKISKINWIIIFVIVLGFLAEYHYLNEQLERKSALDLKSDFKTVSTGVSALTNSFEYGAAITRYRVETLTRQMLRYNVNYINEKIIGPTPMDGNVLAERVRQVREGGTSENLIIMGLYDNEKKQFLLGKDYFSAASSLPVKGFDQLVAEAKVKDEAFKSFALGQDIFNRIDVFMRYNPTAGVTVIGAIPRNSLRAAYEDNVDVSVLHGELLGNHSPENEGYILLYSKLGTLMTSNWRRDGKEDFMHDRDGTSLYDLLKNQQEKVITYSAVDQSGTIKEFYAYGDMSGETLIVVVKDKASADQHMQAIQLMMKAVTVLMMMLMFGLVMLVYEANPIEELIV